MGVSKGINSYAGFGAEVTYGTKGVIDLFHRIIDINIRHEKVQFTPESLSPDWFPDMYYSAGRNLGNVVFEQGFTGLELWWHMLMGTYTYGVNTPVAGTNTHTFAYVPATNNPPSTSIEAARGVGGAKECAYLGIYPVKAVLEFASRQPMKVTFDVVGQGFQRGALTTATFAVHLPVLPAHRSTLTVHGTALSILSGRIEIEAKRADDREHYGDTLFKQPVIIDRPTASFTFECEHGDETGVDTDAIQALYEAGTKVTSMVLAHQGSIITGATKYEFRINAAGAYLEDPTPTSVGKKITNCTVKGNVVTGLTATMINATTQVT